MRLKDNSVNPGPHAIPLAMMIVNDILKRHGINADINSIQDGLHSRKSLHYSTNADAFDVDTDGMKDEEQAKQIAKEIKDDLNIHYDVVLEWDNSHIHIESQPRGRLIYK